MKMKSLTLLLAAGAVLVLVLSPHTRAADDPTRMEPVKSVYDNYLKIQSSLVMDSIKGVSDEAGAIAKAVKGDSMKMLPADVGSQAEALVKATDLSSAREAFKPLSKSLIQYLADNKVHSDSFTEVYCSMADASWLQSETEVHNPYLGKTMPSCGEIKHTY